MLQLPDMREGESLGRVALSVIEKVVVPVRGRLTRCRQPFRGSLRGLS